MIYCDTSFLLSLYVADSHSELASRLVGEVAASLLWTRWHELEFVAALEARVGRGDTMREEADAIYSLLIDHRNSGFLLRRGLASWPEVFDKSISLARNYASEYMNRSLDLLHVASCLELGLDVFWSFDQRQRALAERLGLELNSLE